MKHNLATASFLFSELHVRSSPRKSSIMWPRIRKSSITWPRLPTQRPTSAVSESNLPQNGMSRSTEWERLLPMKKPTQHLIAEVPRSSSRVGMKLPVNGVIGNLLWVCHPVLKEAQE